MHSLLRNAINALLLSIFALGPCGCSDNHNKLSAEQAKAAAPSPPAAGEQCKHGAAKTECFICDPSLRDKDRLWCKEHDRYEDRCWLCHPEMEEKDRLYCKEHSLYEDECFLCHPELKNDKKADGSHKQGQRLLCKEHKVFEDECGICHPELAAKLEPGRGLKVRFASKEAAAKAGVGTSKPEVTEMSAGIEALAEITFNHNKLAQITPLLSGVIKSVEADLGSKVKEGARLATVTSGAIAEAQSAYLRAAAEDQLRKKTLARERRLRADRITSEKDLHEAEAGQQAATAALQQARQQLVVLGFDDEQIEALSKGQANTGVLEVRAPFAGEIVERNAVRGAMAEVGKPLFTVADLSSMWAMLTIPESQLARVKSGQKVEVTVESMPGEQFTGEITWISPQVDDRTRMAKARAELENAGGRLRAHMFARAKIVTKQTAEAVVIPRGALQEVDGKPYAFVKLEDDVFELRAVRPGTEQNGQLQIIEGLEASDDVVTRGTFTVKSQFLISRLGAGCTDD